MAGVLERDRCLVLGLSECWAGCAGGAMGVVDAVVGAVDTVAAAVGGRATDAADTTYVAVAVCGCLLWMGLCCFENL